MPTSITTTQEVLNKLHRIEGFRGYKTGKKPTHSELIEQLCNEELKRIEEERKPPEE